MTEANPLAVSLPPVDLPAGVCHFVATPIGNIRFDERGDAVGVGFAMYQVKNGKYVEVR